MKVMQIVRGAVVVSLIGVPALAWAAEGDGETVNANPAQQSAPAEPGKWEAAGREVRDAAGAVLEATKESTGTAWDSVKSGSAEVWDKTKSGSQEVWHATREESQDWWQKGKAMIHEATAPEPAPAPPAATTPVEPVSPPPSAPPAQ